MIVQLEVMTADQSGLQVVQENHSLAAMLVPVETLLVQVQTQDHLVESGLQKDQLVMTELLAESGLLKDQLVMTVLQEDNGLIQDQLVIIVHQDANGLQNVQLVK